ncbi:MAG: hypothetical protein ACLFT1_05375 [Desulfonatronovibrio sp.]
MGFFSKIKKIWKKEEQPPKEISPARQPEPDKSIAEAREDQQWKSSLRKSLSLAEPRLSVWLDHLLKGIEKKGDALWERLYFLF